MDRTASSRQNRFADLIRSNAVYVDKTLFIEQFLEKNSHIALFSRPGGFGKSLLLDMTAAFFDADGNDGKMLFSHLDITKNQSLCHEHMNRYPVLAFDFSGIPRHHEDAVRHISCVVENQFSRYEHILESNIVNKIEHKLFENIRNSLHEEATISDSIYYLSNILCRQYGKRVIILIDSCDSPLFSRAEDDLKKTGRLLDSMFSSWLKNNEYLEFAILMCRSSSVASSFFSRFNQYDVFDCSRYSFSDSFGFTQDEVDRLLEKVLLTDKRDILRDRYDGYTFGQRTSVYCPEDILNCTKAFHEIGDFTPCSCRFHLENDGILKHLADTCADPTLGGDLRVLLNGGTVSVSLKMKVDVLARHPARNDVLTLFHEFGLLTHCDGDTGGPGWTRLRLPNRAAREALQRLLTA